MRDTLLPVKFEQYQGESKFIFHDMTYERKELLGKGTTASVYRFHPINSVSPAQSVAVKIECSIKYRNGDRFSEGVSFFLDAYWNQQLYGLGVLSGNPNSIMRPHYLMMPYFHGVLANTIKLNTVRELVEWFIMVASFIHETMHVENKAVHGDIKADNIIFQPAEKRIFLIDFGLTEKMGQQIGKYSLPVKMDLVLGVRKLSPSKACPHTAPELFGNTLIAAEPSQDAYSLGYFLFSWIAKLDRITSDEKMKIYAVVASLRAISPKMRCPIPVAISTLHADFIVFVPRSISNGCSEAINQHVGKPAVSSGAPLLTNAIVERELGLVKYCDSSSDDRGAPRDVSLPARANGDVHENQRARAEPGDAVFKNKREPLPLSLLFAPYPTSKNSDPCSKSSEKSSGGQYSR